MSPGNHSRSAGLVQSSIPVSPYSKSHQRREKRKEKQSLKLGAITAALEETTPVDLAMVDTSAAAAPSAAKPRTADLKQALDAESRKLTSARGAATGSGKRKPTSPGKIGEDTAQKTLSAKQRQKMLHVSSFAARLVVPSDRSDTRLLRSNRHTVHKKRHACRPFFRTSLTPPRHSRRSACMRRTPSCLWKSLAGRELRVLLRSGKRSFVYGTGRRVSVI